MLDGAVVIPIQTMVWNLLFEFAALLWVVDRALLSVGYFILVLTGWLTQNVFAPLLGIVSEQTGVLVGPLFLIALTILGFTYLMAVFGRFEVVNLRSAVMWLLFAATLYTFGPGIYLGLEDFRRLVGGGFYQAGVEAFNDAGSATGLNAIGTLPSDAVAVPTDQFGQFLPSVPGATAVDGLDVAMAYIGADGYDVLAAIGAPHLIARLPWTMVEEGRDGFFDPDTGPNAFNSMTDADRQASIGRALQGVWRAFTTIFIAIFGIIEQLVNFLMAASFAVAFFSMFIAVLFGFFIRTEPIAWGAFNLIIELFIQSIINSLLMSLVLGFVMVGANTGNAILLLGAALVGLWLSWNLLQGCIKALMNSSERLYKSFSASTGGNFATVSETNKSMGDATISAATGASVLAGGGSFLQALGATFGDSRTAQTMNYASRMLGGEETLLGSAAQSIGEGASARSLAGPLGGYLLGQQSKTAGHEEREATTRRRYRGENDYTRDAALHDYVETGAEDALDTAFSPSDKPKVQALHDSFEPEDFNAVVNAVRNVRNDNPSLPPQSPAFTAKVREQLPSPLKEMEAPALDDFAQVFGKAADASPYAAALDLYTPPNIPIPSLGNADFARDDMVGDYRQAQAAGQPLPNMADAFSPEDANRVAQLMDAYDDDDFAQAVYAVRAAREANPDMPTGSSQALQATRRNLPAHLQTMPSRDLAAFSTAFGASATIPAIPDTPPATYLGNADRDRDTVVAAYRDGDEAADILEQSFSAQDARDVAILANDYERDDFDAVVRTVRQARTADPDMEAGSPYAVRQARKLLPEHLRQMPSRDLTAYSRAFGTSADTPSVRERRSSSSQRSSRLPRPRSFAEQRADDFTLQGNTLETEAENMSDLEFVAEDLALPLEQTDTADEIPVNPSSGTPALPVLTATDISHHEPLPTREVSPIPAMRGLGTARLQRLAAMGISTLEELQAAPPMAIASALRVSAGQVQSWQMQAQTLLETGEVAAASIQTGLHGASQMTGQSNPSPLVDVPQMPTTPNVLRQAPSQQTSTNTAPLVPPVAQPSSQLQQDNVPQRQRQQVNGNAQESEPSVQVTSASNIPSTFTSKQPLAPIQTQQVNVSEQANQQMGQWDSVTNSPHQGIQQPSGQTDSNSEVTSTFVQNTPDAPVQSNQVNAPIQLNQQMGQQNSVPNSPQQDVQQPIGQVASAPNVPPAFAPNEPQQSTPQSFVPTTPQTPVQIPQVEVHQQAVQQTGGQVLSTPSVPQSFVPNAPQQSNEQPSGQVASAPNVPPTFIPNTPHTPIQTQPINVPQQPNQETDVKGASVPNIPQQGSQQPSEQVVSLPNVPPTFISNTPQAPVQANQFNAPQQPIQQVSEQNASTPNVSAIPQQRDQGTSDSNVQPTFAPNEPQQSTPQPSEQTVSTPNVPSAFVPNQSQTPIQTQQENLRQQPIQQTSGQAQQGNVSQQPLSQGSRQVNPTITPNAPSAFVPNTPQVPVQSPQINVPQQPSGQTASTPNVPSAFVPKGSGQVNPTIAPNAPQAPVQSQQANVPQQLNQQTGVQRTAVPSPLQQGSQQASGQVKPAPNVPPTFIPNAPVQANQVNAPQPPIQQASGQIASTPNLPPAPQGRGQGTSVPNISQPSTPQSSGQTAFTPSVPQSFVPTTLQTPVQTQQENLPQQPVQQTGEQVKPASSVPPTFIPNAPQTPVQSNQVNTPQPPIQQTSGQIASTLNVPPTPQGRGQVTSAPNIPQPSTPQPSGQTASTPNAPSAFVPNQSQTPIQTQQANLPQQTVQQTSEQVKPASSVPPTFIPNAPQTPAQANQVNAPQAPIQQTSGQTNRASSPNVPPVPQGSSQVTSAPNIPPAFAPNEAQQLTPQPSGQTASTPNVPSAFVPNQSQTPIQTQQANLSQQPNQQTGVQMNLASPAPQTPSQQSNPPQTTNQQARGQLNPAPPAPTTWQVQLNPQIPSTSPQTAQRHVAEPQLNRPTISSTTASNAESQSPSMATKQNEGFSQHDATIPPAPMATNSGDSQPTESEKPAEQKPEPAQNGDLAE